MESEKKQKILELLSNYQRLSTGRIAAEIKVSQPYARKYLEELEKEKKVKREKETLATYWRLSDGTKQKKL